MKMFSTKLFYVLVFLSLSLSGFSQTIEIDDLPETLTLLPDDQFLVNHTVGITLTASKIPFSNFASLAVSAGLAIPKSKMLWVETTGNDTSALAAGDHDFTKPFLTIAAALAQATSGDVVQVGLGTFIQTAPLTVPTGVTLRGTTRDGTIIRNSVGTLDRAVIFPSSNSFVSDLTILADTPVTFQAPYGAALSDAVTHGSVATNIHIIGDSDGVYLRNDGTSSVKLVRCLIETKYAAVDLYYSVSIGTGDTTSRVAEFWDCTLIVTGPSLVTTPQAWNGTSLGIGIHGIGCGVRFYNGSIRVTGGTATNTGAFATLSGFLHLYNTTIDVPSGEVSPFDIIGNANTSASGVYRKDGTALVTSGTVLNPSLYLAKTANLSDVANIATSRNNLLPAQTSNAGKFLQTDGTNVSWVAETGNAVTGNPLSQFASTTSAQLFGVMSDKTGTGILVFGTSPTLVTPNIGAATGSSFAFGTATVSSSIAFPSAIAYNTKAVGLSLSNSLAAVTGGNQSWSPMLRFSGRGWKTDAASASRNMDWQMYGIPIEGAALPSGYFLLETRISNSEANAPYGRFAFFTGGGVSIGTDTFIDPGQGMLHTKGLFYSALVQDISGSGTPEGVIALGVGSTYRRTDGGAATSFYVKESGTGNTGWKPYGSTAGFGDASTNTSSSVDSELAVFSSTTGKLLKRAVGNGIVQVTSGVMSIAVAGTNYVLPNGVLAFAGFSSITGILSIANGGTGVATLTTYAPLFGGTTGTGAIQSGTVGTSGQLLKSNGAGALPTFQTIAKSVIGTAHWDASGASVASLTMDGAITNVVYTAVGDYAVTLTGQTDVHYIVTGSARLQGTLGQAYIVAPNTQVNGGFNLRVYRASTEALANVDRVEIQVTRLSP